MLTDFPPYLIKPEFHFTLNQYTDLEIIIKICFREPYIRYHFRNLKISD